MRITSKGQVTIPIDVREKLGLLPNTEVGFEVHGKGAHLVKGPPNEDPPNEAGGAAQTRWLVCEARLT